MGAGAVEVEEADVEGAKIGGVEIGKAVGGGEVEVSRREAAFALGGEEDCDARNEKGLGETFDDGVQQGAEVGLGVDAAAEFDEGLAVVEAFLIEDTVDAGLNGSFEWIEDDSCDDDGSQQSPDAEVGEAAVDDLTGEGDDAEVDTDQ